MFAIAEVAGADWPQRAAGAFATLTSGDDLDAQGIGATLLADIAAVFAAAGVHKLASARLAEELAAIEGRPWAEWGKKRQKISPNQLANQLRKFGIASRAIRVGTETPRGFLLADFADAFDRFLPQTPVPKCNSATTIENIGDSSPSETQHAESVLQSETATSAKKGAACCTVALGNPQLDEVLL